MKDEVKDNGSQPENFSNMADELFEKGKDLADKAETIFNDTVNKAKGSGTFVKLSGFIGKVEDFMEEKSDEFQSGEYGAKIDDFKEKTGSQVSELLKKVKDTGLKIGDQVDEALDSIKGKHDRADNEGGAGI
jgi:hypothetical protein